MIRNWQAPGDFVVLSAAIRDISLAYPRRYEFGIEVPNKDVYANNPYIKPIPLNGARRLQAKYPLIHHSNQNRFHFLWGFLDYLNKSLGVKAPLTELRPDLHLTPSEKASPPAYVKKPYWVYASGGKTDYTAKWWDPTCWQQVVKMMAPKYQMVQVGGASHKHPKMETVPNTVDMVGKTSLRELMRLIYHSDGVLSIVTSLMHIAAAFNKPAVTIAGGREPWWWEAYTLENREFNLKVSNPTWTRPDNDDYIPHRYLHTIGELSCCKTGGCWKSKAERGTNNKGGSICVLPAIQNGVKLPRCLQAITPEIVVQNAEWYYREGIIGMPRTLVSIPVPMGSAVLVPVDGRTLPILNTPTPAPAIINLPRRFEAVEPAAPIGNVNVFAYCEDANQEAQYTENCTLNSTGLPSSFSFTKLLNSGGTRADYMRKALELCTGTWLVWIDGNVRLKPKWYERLNSLGTGEILGVAYWHPLSAVDVTQIVRAPWYREEKYEEHRTEGRTWRTTHPGERFFAASVELLKQVGWPFGAKPAVYLGAAMKQQQIKLANACELLETA